MTKTLTTTEIQTWLNYWQHGDMVAVDRIRAFDHVYEARKYCACMRTGIFADVTDLQIWLAIRDMRGEFMTVGEAA